MKLPRDVKIRDYVGKYLHHSAVTTRKCPSLGHCRYIVTLHDRLRFSDLLYMPILRFGESNKI